LQHGFAYFLISSCILSGNGVNYQIFPKGNVMAIAALSSGITGLNVAQRALGNSAHAIANIGTQGFQPAQATFAENTPAGTGVSISMRGQELQQVDAPSATNLAVETTNSLVYKAQFDLSAKVVQAADQNLGTLIDIKA
jgi:flagellar hook protein FlgE